jgi:hypothetical protein
MLSNRQIGASLASIMLFVSLASAQVITSNPNLPPSTGAYYMTPSQIHAAYSEGLLTVDMTQFLYEPNFADTVSVLYDGSGNEFDTYNSQGSALISINGGPAAPLTLAGPVSVEDLGKQGFPTGVFNTQMLSLDLTGSVSGHSVEIMLDPTLGNSIGQTSITDVGGGQYQITSFFDIFTELSLDGGPFLPQTQATSPSYVTLQNLPEPSSMTLLAISSLTLLRRRRGTTQSTT